MGRRQPLSLGERIAVQGGALPAGAGDVLRRIADGRSPASATLDAMGALAIATRGFEVAGAVLGAAAFSGPPRREDEWTPGPGRDRGVPHGTVPHDGRSEARRRALRRLEAEAAIVHADLVVDVGLRERRHGPVWEVVATGTALRTGAEGSARVALLGIGDVALLLAHGARPLGAIAVEASVRVGESPRQLRRRRDGGPLTADEEARDEATRRALAAAREAAGRGVLVGVRIDRVESEHEVEVTDPDQERRPGRPESTIRRRVVHATTHLLATAVGRPATTIARPSPTLPLGSA